MQYIVFQKQSPFLDDMNSFIHLAKQMGLIDMSYYNNLPNATKCRTINDVHKSHIEQNHTVTVEVNDIYGMLILLGLGVGGSLITFIAEVITLVRFKFPINVATRKRKQKKNAAKTELMIWPRREAQRNDTISDVVI